MFTTEPRHRSRSAAGASAAPALARQPVVFPSAKPDQATLESYVSARATAPDGRSAEDWLQTGEGYPYTAAAAMSSVEAVLASEPLGASTVAAAFGPQIAFSAGGELLATA